jgi:hypothetical protein
LEGDVISRSSCFAAIVAAGVAIAATAHAASPTASSQAEQTCAKHGVQPRSSAWELCLSHVTRAYEWGEFTLANQLARAAGDARMNCLEYGQQPESRGYRACVNKEIEARSELLILGDDQSGVNLAEAR